MVMTTESKIKMITASLTKFLIEKNRRYGDSALNPIKIFSKHGNQIEVRIDDKLSRIRNASTLRKNDVVDLLGYLVLLCARENWTKFDELID